MGKLTNKVAVITGGTSGIGKATARAFLAEGATVILTGRYPATVQQTVTELSVSAHGLVSDAGKMADVRLLAPQIRALTPRIDIVFVNAGYARYGLLEAVDEAQFDEQFNVLVKGVYFTIQELVPLMIEGGAIVLNTSTVTELGLPTWSVYSAAKSAVQSLNKTLATELISRHIRFNAVAPSYTDTPMWDRVLGDQKQVVLNNVAQKLPVRRIATAEEVAAAVVFMMANPSITGEVIHVDGGGRLI